MRALALALVVVALTACAPKAETSREVCERRIAARLSWSARERLPPEPAGDGATRVPQLPPGAATDIAARARALCARVPEGPVLTPTPIVRAHAAALAAAVCCATDESGRCHWWSTAGCPSPDPRPVACCDRRPDGSCGWWSRMGCP